MNNEYYILLKNFKYDEYLNKSFISVAVQEKIHFVKEIRRCTERLLSPGSDNTEMMETITSFRFESHMMRAFSDEEQGDDVQRKFVKKEKGRTVWEKNNQTNTQTTYFFTIFQLVFLKISPLVRETNQDVVQMGATIFSVCGPAHISGQVQMIF